MSNFDNRSLEKFDPSNFNNNLFEYKLAIQRENHAELLDKEKLQMIHPDVNVYYNSLNVLCGPQGSGKTYTACKECAKISQTDPYAHLLVIICKDENKDDPTVNMIKPLIKVPIVYVTEDNAVDYVKKLFACKRLYNKVKEENIEDAIIPQQVRQIFKILHINDFHSPWLHTMIMINDSAKCALLKSGSYFSNMIALGRHTQTSSFLNIQFWKGLSPEIKANISTAFIFGLYSRQQFTHIISQLPSQYDYAEIYPLYRKLSKQEKIVFRSGDVYVET